MSKTARFISTALAATVITLISVLAPATAHAGTDTRQWTKGTSQYPSGAGSVKFEHYGEIFRVEDNHIDGAGVWVQIKYDDIWANPPTQRNSRGAGTVSSFNYEFPEGASVWFVVCLIDDGIVQTATCNNGYATA
ncbi:hypothetical protein [Saccharomonospora piscinae]|uniref:Secreted protein n=1 Tax=Saccharomonospora piscinae TaxID=687388 RepID=A0A1V9AD64_SACPI|nr:hypothetical protein [Saccharomonospora piscinae]OQO95069.1 hypothetical protein B1813_03165 [Saccharomonospora piscinae]TLW90463.1 hypothetical protein FFT09_21375 [Saccharomonospora piscinae]